MARAAADAQDAHTPQVRQVHVDARAEREAAAGPLHAVARDDAANDERTSGQAHRVAHRHAQRRQELRLDDRALAGEQRVRVHGAAPELQRAVERERGLDAADLDQPHRAGVPGRSGAAAIVCVSTTSVRPRTSGPARAVLRRARTSVVNGRVDCTVMSAPTRLPRLPRERRPHVLHDAAEHDDGGHAERDAEEEEHQPAPRRARLAPRHADGEPDAGARHGAGSTTRPSRSAIFSSASAASSTSCVTRTSVRPRRRFTAMSKSMTYPSGRAIEVTGRLVGQDDRRVVRERAGDRHALLFAAGELRRVVMPAAREAHIVDERAGAIARVGGAGDLHGHEDVLERRQRRQQMEELEDDADLLAAEPGEALLAERRDLRRRRARSGPWWARRGRR